MSAVQYPTPFQRHTTGIDIEHSLHSSDTGEKMGCSETVHQLCVDFKKAHDSVISQYSDRVWGTYETR
jgi:hypothetical protein